VVDFEKGFTPEELAKRRPFRIAMLAFAVVGYLFWMLFRHALHTNDLVFPVFMALFFGFLVTGVIASSHSPPVKALVALFAVLAALGLAFWAFVGLTRIGPGMRPSVWFSMPFLVVCAVGAAALLFFAARFSRR